MSRLARAAKLILSDVGHFSRCVIRLPLRPYQRQAIDALIDSILHRRGREYLLIFPRQSGKNEAVAQLLVYLLNLYQRVGGNVVYGAVGDALGLGRDRLEERLDNAWNAGKWTKRTKPDRRCLGKACVVFLSTHPTASTRGQTAHLLLVIDEAQDQLTHHIEAVFTPMRAANNATAVYIGTVRTTHDFLWLKKQELERAQAADGHRRVFMVHPDQVTKENPAYKRFLDAQVRKHGRSHPIVASEYFLEPLDADGGLFSARRLVLMRGAHKRAREPDPHQLHVATLDVAGQDEATTDAVALLDHPARDYTIATIWRVDDPPLGGDDPDPRQQRAVPKRGSSRNYDPTAVEDPQSSSPEGRLGNWTPGPTYCAVDVFVDHGSRHFEDAPGKPALVKRLAAFLEHWQIGHLVTDDSGVGEGITSWLTAALGAARVTGFSFAKRGKKAWLGSAFLSLVETNRVKYWSDDADEIGSDGWWFWRQAEACTYHIPPGGRFDMDLQWGVPASATIATPEGRLPIHDDRLLSAALIAELDRLKATGELRIGTAESAIIEADDPLEDLRF